jgi:hypothetical protein
MGAYFGVKTQLTVMCVSLANIIKTINNNSMVYQVVARLTTT